MLNDLKANNALRLLAAAPTRARARLGNNLELLINLLVITAALVFMLYQGPGFAIRIAQLFAIFAILVVSLNLIIGYTGLLSVAHVAFFGIGAYTVAVLTTNPEYEQVPGHIRYFDWSFFAALPVGMLLAGVVALFVGGVLSRFRDDLFVLVSVGFAVIAHRVFLFWQPVTRGAFGIHAIAKPSIFGLVIDGRMEFMFLTLGFLALVYLVSWLIVRSSFGRVLMAIREDEQAIEVFGYRASMYKLMIWVISAMMAALAGGLVASEQSFIDPNSFLLLESILLVCIVILGGLGTLSGSLLGALVFVLMNEGMRFLPFLPDALIGQARLAILGMLIVALMLFRPQGLVGKFKL
ncbi:MAG: branched-chain amino acid ABC transporter permease [Chloroflexi bacterium]|nr:branched-chain amino acid ABC transporter permease [Chloroflexota bacterium]MCI0788317.1 branched-chain amino acid ABC transporter permease [Chloroflexota bacterium]MCI0811330.1 branched-chain amino acid ABC transporter permease [Chloroflexota bacterium]